MSFFSRSKRFPLSALALAFLITSPLIAFADAPPGAYLQSTTKTQKPLAGSAQQTQSLAPQINSADAGSGIKYGQPLSDSMNNSGASSQNNWNSNASGQAPGQYQSDNQVQGSGQQQSWSGGQPTMGSQPAMGWQSMTNAQPGFQQNAPASSPQYSGYAQQSNNVPQGYPPAQNYPQQATNGGGANWQADYPSPNDLNNSQQPMAPPNNANAQYGQPQYPVNQAQIPPPAPVPVAAKPAADPDDGTSKTISAIANTVLPIATSMVTNAIMNKMMYGTMNPGYGNSMYGNQMYGNPYGGMRNPMRGYGYNRPNLLNGVMGGGNGGLGGLLNTHY